MRLITALTGLTLLAGPAAADQVYENALIWTGEGFTPGALAVRDGAFIPLEEAAADAERIDLEGGFVTPGFANAHQHITNANAETSDAFLADGVFYVWNPNILARFVTEEARAFYDRRETYDVAFSMGGITEPDGHPEKLYEDILQPWVYPDIPAEDMLGDAFHYGRTPEEIDASLDRLVEQGADFVKAYLLHAEDYQERRDDDIYRGLKGLDPANFAYLVDAAHARGLPVATHVETPFDFSAAVAGGADMMAHMPGYGAPRTAREAERYRIAEADARSAGARGTLIVPTYGLSVSAYAQGRERAPDGYEDGVEAVLEATQGHNLRLLQAAGAPILTGTDGGPAIFGEAERFVAVGGLSDLEAVQAALRTGAALFPDRRIGCFAPGCEADFLVLDADPSGDVSALRSIRLRIKAGERVGETADSAD